MKKKLYILIILLCFHNFQAQNISFADSYFKNILITQNTTDTNNDGLPDAIIDLNSDGEIQVSEAQVVDNLYIESGSIKQLAGIENFINLKILYAGGNKLSNDTYNTIVNLTSLTQLETLSLRFRNVSIPLPSDTMPYGVDVSGASGLKNLHLDYYTSILNLHPNSKLVKLSLGSKLLSTMNHLPHSFTLENLVIDNFYDLGSSGNTFDLSHFYILKEITFSKGWNTTVPNISSIIGYFTQLKKLHIYPLFNNIDYNQFPSLEDFSINTSTISNINFPFWGLLKKLNLYLNNVYQTVNLGQNGNLTSLNISNLYSPLLIGNNNNLINVTISGGSQSELNFSGATNIQNLKIQANSYLPYLNLRKLILGNNVSLKKLIIYNRYELDSYSENITDLNLSNINTLDSIDIIGLNISHLNIGNNPNIKLINYSGKSLQKITIGKTPQLRLLRLHRTGLVFPNNYFTDLDLSGATYQGPALWEKLNLSGFDEIQTINLKNGVVEPKIKVISNNPVNFCLDDDADEIFFAKYWWEKPTGSNISPYCNFVPSGEYNTIKGIAKIDLNGTGCVTSGSFFSPLKIKSSINNDGYTYNNSQGEYSFYSKNLNFQLMPIFENNYFTVTPSNSTHLFSNFGNTVTQDFCVSPNGVHNDLEVIVIPLDTPFAGGTSQYKIIYRNKGTSIMSGSIEFNYPLSINYINSSLNPTTNNGNTIIWDFLNLQVLEQKEIISTFSINSPTSSPNPLNSGDILSFAANILPVNNDSSPVDNNFFMKQKVVNSMDPNDKVCLEGESIPTSMIGKYLHYLIRFENTGTANAQNIVLKDIIDLSKFEIESLIPMSASHPYRLTVTQGNKLEVFFENIQLPYSTISQNNGYFMFKIKPKSSVVEGDILNNKAEIYFDYNLPVITNEYKTKVENVVLASLEKESMDNDIVIYPNPAFNHININTKDKIKKIEILDLSGRLIKISIGNVKMVHINELNSGNYILKITTNQNQYLKKFIKK